MENTERRLEGRFLCADVVKVTRVEGDPRKTLEAVLEDISPLGACVQVEEQIPLGMEVVLSSGGKCLSGVVSYCVYRDYGFFVGIHFLDETHWSKGVFVPDHLTSLAALAMRCMD
jgi:hypothetical protein